MKIKTHKSVFIYMLSIIFFTGCTKDETHFYPDPQMPDLAIFSNTGNNVSTGIINGQPWRTFDRKYNGFAPPRYEVSINKQYFDSATDIIYIKWDGYLGGNQYNYLNVTLAMSVAKNFSLADFSAMQGTRVTIDGMHNYFLAESQSNNTRGFGSIYFNVLQFDSSAVTGGIQGKLSGLMEADFNAFQLVSGRFDHDLVGRQILFY